MTLNRNAQRAMIAIFFAALAAVYAVAWLAPGIGLYHDDAAYLVAAKSLAAGHGYLMENLPKPIPETRYPPLFPGLLALFTLISRQTQWLKLLPLACTAGWLVLTRKLLLKMGASWEGALLLIGLTAASPTIVFLSTNLMAESLFALLMTAALLNLLEERAIVASLFAGFATLTRSAGVALIAACILTLVARRRFRSAMVFAAIAMIMVAPWFGWSLANAPHDPYFGGSDYAASNIITGLHAAEKLAVLGRNLLLLLASPFSLLTGWNNMFAIIATVLVFSWSLFIRRQLLPDLFVALYCLMLLCWAWPPERFVAPILPLIFWIVWRVFRLMPLREALAGAVLVAALLPLWSDLQRVPVTRTSGYFTPAGQSPDNWGDMARLFAEIRAKTSPNSVLLANFESVFYLNTDRKTVRGFTPRGFELFYAAQTLAVTPDQLSAAIGQSQINYVVVTPDRDLPESSTFHRAVAALERGGVLEPVSIPGIDPEYRLLHVTQSGF